MHASVSLKQLRTDPRGYVSLLNHGYEVEITEHSKTLVKTKAKNTSRTLKKGDGQALLDYLNHHQPMKTPFPAEDTVQLNKRTRLEYLERKYRYK